MKRSGSKDRNLFKARAKVKLEDLVYGLMLRSGNDAAQVIAENVGGSIEGFVYLMNEKAKQIGMKDTHFSNPHGLMEMDLIIRRPMTWHF